MATAFRTERMIQRLSTRSTDEYHEANIGHDADLHLIDGRGYKQASSICSYTYVDKRKQKLRAGQSRSDV